MMILLNSWLQRTRQRLTVLLQNEKVQMFGRASAWVMGGLLLSAAGIYHGPLPLSMGLLCAGSGWSSVLAALGGSLGYLLFWGEAGNQCLVWLLGGLAASLFVEAGRRRTASPFLVPAIAGLVVSATGVLFQVLFKDNAPVGLYVLRVVLAMGSTWLFSRVREGRNPVTDWLCWGVGVLALAQLSPVAWLNPGVAAGSYLAVSGAFPAAALAGVALDLAGVTPVSMTAVLCAGYLVRFLPKYPKWVAATAPCFVYIFIMSVGGTRDLFPVTGLLLGGILAVALPIQGKIPARRGETGVAQVRLEMAAGALVQAQQLLLEAPVTPVDEDALIDRAAEASCRDCPCRKSCKDRQRLGQLPAAILHKTLHTPEELPIVCRKSGRLLAQLHRAQEQLRSIRADRERQAEYREAVVQQHRFLAEYLHLVSDRLGQRENAKEPCYQAWVKTYGNRRAEENGDKTASFAGVGNRYYVLLCDGMGKGSGAVQEAGIALSLLSRLLTAGYPAEHALSSLNSICALRSRAAAVTVDLVELELDTGRGHLYKWGAPPSYVIAATGTEKIGTAGPPPGLSVGDRRDTAHRLSLRRGETLVLVSDGVGEEEALHCCLSMTGLSPGELATGLLTCSQYAGEDDATVVLVQLDDRSAAS